MIISVKIPNFKLFHQLKNHNILKPGIKQKRRKNKILVLGDLSNPKVFGEGSPTGAYEFSVVSFRDITAATDNFHESYLIGQGGFGKVYKVIFPFILQFWLY
jgi:hypothetical protein